MTFAFGTPICDRINMLQPGHNVGAGNAHDAVLKADNINQWTIYNTLFAGGANAVTVTLGAMATAPDGTNTAQKIVETTTNSVHALQAIAQPGSGNSAITTVAWHVERLAVIAKAAERTRIALVISDFWYPNQPSLTKGVVAVYDLAGGQIAVPGAVFGTAVAPLWQAIGQSITLLSGGGGGWYLCTLDVIIGANTSDSLGPAATFLIDNGSGLAPQSTTYTGDASKGILTWRSNMLPPRAWALTEQIFFDDFNDLSTIDLTNSNAAGFNWYISGNFPQFGGFPTSASDLSVASSILKIGARLDTNPSEMLSIAYKTPFVNGLNPWLGNTFTLPVLMEASWSWDTTPVPLFTASFWIRDAVSLGTQLQPLLYPPTGQLPFQPAGEIDIFENSAAPAGYVPYITSSTSASPQVGGEEEKSVNTPLDSITVWNPGTRFIPGNKVFWMGTYYLNTNTSIGNMPPNASFWSVTAAPVPVLNIDFSQQHVYSMLWIPYVGANDFGQILHFFDGIFAGGICYGPEALPGQGSNYMQAADNLLWPIFLQGGNNYNNFVDWVSVYGLPQSKLSSLRIHDSSATVRNTQATDQSSVGTGPWEASRISLDGVAGSLPVQSMYGYWIDGSAVTLPVKDNTSSTATQTSVASSASSVFLLESGNRLGATIFNDSTQILYVLLSYYEHGPAASTTTYTAQVGPGARYEVPAGYAGGIQGIWASANGFARITEQT